MSDDNGDGGRYVTMSDGARLWTSSTVVPGAPHLLLIHGGPGMWDYLEPVAALFAGTYSTHRFDQRGSGRSSPNDDYRLARFIADIEELRHMMQVRRWHVFGHSFGADLALGYAAAHGQPVRSVVYCGGRGLHWSVHRAAYSAAAREKLTPEQTVRLDELTARGRDWPEEVEWRTLSWVSNYADSAASLDVAAARAATPLPLNVRCNRVLDRELAAAERDEEARHGRVRCPVLVVHGSADPRPVAGPRSLAAVLPRGQFVVLADAGHEPWHERPLAFRAVVSRFLAEH